MQYQNINGSEEENMNDSEDEITEQEIIAASMWTRPEIEQFKQCVAQGEGDGVVRVGHGETVTVRVPTHPEGTRLFWEFATDHYDIGTNIYSNIYQLQFYNDKEQSFSILLHLWDSFE